MCRVEGCYVPGAHKHAPPTEAEVADSRATLTIEHPVSCAWRKDIYDGCSCGVTQHITDLYTLGAVVADVALAVP